MPARRAAGKYPLRSIYFYLTEGCNLHCRHCWIQPKYQTGDRTYPSLDLHLFKHIIEQAKPLGLVGVKLTGGEPLLHPQLMEMLELIRNEKLTITVETNGVLCTREIAERIAAVCSRPSVSVSLDGADAETHEWMRGVKGCFEDTIEGIRNLVRAGARTQIIMSIARRNSRRMEDVVRLAESLGAHSVKFNIVQPTARGAVMQRDGETLDFEELIELGRWVENDLSASTDLPLFHSHPIAFRPMGKMFGETGDGCKRCGIKSILGVLADGEFALCGIGETVPELVFGHASRDRLRDVWEDNSVLCDIREGLPGKLQGACSECLFKQICLGNCIAENYYIAHNLWAPYWYCEEARMKGVFPRSRYFAGDSTRKEASAGGY